jgi:acyl-CoA thioesterase-2
MNHAGALYGGQVLTQALLAAARLTPGKQPHSAHGYFLRAGSAEAPIDYEVETLREGRRAAARRVQALQDGKLIFHLHCSFIEPLHGFEHQVDAPAGLPRPEALQPRADYVAAHAERLSARTVADYGGPFPLDLRLIEPERFFFELLPEPKRGFWLRMPSADEIDDPVLHSCLAAFATDYWLGGVGAGAHVLATDRTTLQIISLDHGIWFHRPVRADEWLLYLTDSPSAQQGRGLARGLLYDQAGALVATIAQECLLLPI